MFFQQILDLLRLCHPSTPALTDTLEMFHLKRGQLGEGWGLKNERANLNDEFDSISSRGSVSCLWLQFSTSVTDELMKRKMLIIHHGTELEHDVLVPEIVLVAHL